MTSLTNIYDFPQSSQEELFDTLLETPSARIERIVSYGQASSEGFWYDQDEDEWVSVIEGGADIFFEGELAPRRLGKGDILLIPAHTRHRVSRTDNPTVWLAVFLRS
jgi:cupin 2 domain-containing protein